MVIYFFVLIPIVLTCSPIRINVLEGAAFTPLMQALLDSEVFRSIAQSILRSQLSSLSSAMAPFSLSVLGNIATEPGNKSIFQGSKQYTSCRVRLQYVRLYHKWKSGLIGRFYR